MTRREINARVGTGLDILACIKMGLGKPGDTSSVLVGAIMGVIVYMWPGLRAYSVEWLVCQGQVSQVLPYI